MSKYAEVVFEESTEITREADPKDRWSGEDTETIWRIPRRFRVVDSFNYYGEPILFDPVPGQEYFMVYAIWSTGDSFSHHERGSCECFGIYETYDQAAKRKEELSTPVKGKYRPWEGYFERLNELEIETIRYMP